MIVKDTTLELKALVTACVYAVDGRNDHAKRQSKGVMNLHPATS